MNNTRKGCLGLNDVIDLQHTLRVPETYRNGLFKCRVIYDKSICKIEFLPYQIKEIRSLRMVDGSQISYAHKFLERREIRTMLRKSRGCDDILIVKDGYITDSSYCNIVFLRGKTWVTPSTYLLGGIQRQFGLDRGLFKEEEIRVKDLCAFSHFKLINAMRPFSKVKKQPIHQIRI